MTICRFEYLSGESTVQIDVDRPDVHRMRIKTHRKQSIQQTEDRLYLLYVLGIAWYEFNFIFEPTPHMIEVVNQLRLVRVPIKVYYKYHYNPSVYKTVKVDPNVSIPYVSGYINADATISMTFYETGV